MMQKIEAKIRKYNSFFQSPRPLSKCISDDFSASFHIFKHNKSNFMP